MSKLSGSQLDRMAAKLREAQIEAAYAEKETVPEVPFFQDVEPPVEILTDFEVMAFMADQGLEPKGTTAMAAAQKALFATGYEPRGATVTDEHIHTTPVAVSNGGKRFLGDDGPTYGKSRKSPQERADIERRARLRIQAITLSQ